MHNLRSYAATEDGSRPQPMILEDRGDEKHSCSWQVFASVVIDDALYPDHMCVLSSQSEQAIALHDLLSVGALRVLQSGPPPNQGDVCGPYSLRLSKKGDCFYFHFQDCNKRSFASFSVSVSVLQAIIRDYKALCRCHQKAAQVASLPRVESLDMGRRGLHNENADFIHERALAVGVEMDRETSRRLFTLICTLQL